MKWRLLEGIVGVWGWEEKCERKNSFFKYYNIKFFESQEGWNGGKVEVLVCELKGK